MKMPEQKPFIYACSGASDVGGLADAAARKLTKDGDGQMQCLVGIGGRIEFLMENAKNNPRKLVIDGCGKNCAKASMELAGIKDFTYLNLADHGFIKGECPVVDSNIIRATEIAKRSIGHD
jgi:uncharacterized metal-binding protein